MAKKATYASEWEKIARRIRRLGYGETLPDMPKRVTKKSLEAQKKRLARAVEASKEYSKAKARVRYAQKKGVAVSTPFERGGSAASYKKWTSKRIKKEAKKQEQQRKKYIEDVEKNRRELSQPQAAPPVDDFEDRIINRCLDVLENWEPPFYWQPAYINAVDALRMRMLSAFNAEVAKNKTALAAKLEANAERIIEEMNRVLYDSDSLTEKTGDAVSIIMEITTGSAFSAEQFADSDLTAGEYY